MRFTSGIEGQTTRNGERPILAREPIDLKAYLPSTLVDTGNLEPATSIDHKRCRREIELNIELENT